MGRCSFPPPSSTTGSLSALVRRDSANARPCYWEMSVSICTENGSKVGKPRAQTKDGLFPGRSLQTSPYHSFCPVDAHHKSSLRSQQCSTCKVLAGGMSLPGSGGQQEQVCEVGASAWGSMAGAQHRLGLSSRPTDTWASQQMLLTPRPPLPSWWLQWTTARAAGFYLRLPLLLATALSLPCSACMQGRRVPRTLCAGWKLGPKQVTLGVTPIPQMAHPEVLLQSPRRGPGHGGPCPGGPASLTDLPLSSLPPQQLHLGSPLK